MPLAPSKEGSKVAIELLLKPVLQNRLDMSRCGRSGSRETLAELVEVQPDQSE